MITLVKSYFVPMMVLLIIFLNEICSSTQILAGITDTSIVEHAWAILLAGVTYAMLLLDWKKCKLPKSNIRVLAFLSVILVLYYVTSFFYSEFRPRHFSYFLVFISESIPAAYIGMRLVRSGNFDKINNLLPLFIIPNALLIGTIGVQYAAIGERVNNDDSGLNYQTVSYYMAFCYSYAIYYVFFNRKTKGLFMLIMRGVMLLIMFYCGMVCLVSGGRGAFVFIIFITLFFAYSYLKNTKKHRIRTIAILIIIAVVVIWLINRFNVMESAGMLRVMDKMTEDDHRKYLYNKAYQAFIASPIFGNGVGSVWWTVGYYSHNMILDFLSEVGVLGSLIVLTILTKTAKKMYNLSKLNHIFIFFLIVMLGALMRLMFSSYWVSAVKLFFVCSLIYSYPMIKLKKEQLWKN